MQQDRSTTVLFADVSGSTKLYETAGDALAEKTVRACIERMTRCVHDAGGRVVKTIGDEVMAVFSTPGAAASAAAEMQSTIDALPEVAGMKLALRIGFQSGPVVQRDDDVFGDTVNLAARLVGQAVKGQIITSSETAALLGPIFRSWTRRLYAIQVKGKSDEVELCELVWNQSGEMTAMGSTVPTAVRRAVSVLRLDYNGLVVTRRREVDSITLGRDTTCGLVVAEAMASRLHCTIERRQDKWVLTDHSTNGTFVTIEGDRELLLRRETLSLRMKGTIAFGQSRAKATGVVEFSLD